MPTRKGQQAPKTISPHEMVRVYKRIHLLLSKRVRDAKRENSASKGRDKKLLKNYIDSAKDLYAYVRIMDVCKNLSKDVDSLKSVIDSLSKTSYLMSDAGIHEKPN